MVFLHPAFLWGLWALVIPVIIHLFDFRKTRKVYFPDIRFLKQVKQHSSKPLKLKQWLILLARLGFITFLVLLFAQPIIPNKDANKIGKGVLLMYIDNSQSMSSLVNPKQNSLEVAKVIGQGIIDQLPKDQDVIILSNDGFNKFISPTNLEKASEQLTAINLSEKVFSLQNLTSKINEYARKSTNLSDVFIIGDFQKSTSKLITQKMDTTLSFWLSPIVQANSENCVVDTVYLEDVNLTSGGDRRIQVVIANNGNKEKEEMPVKLYLGDRQVSAATISVPAYQKKNIVFSVGKVKGPISGYVQLEDYPNTFDDRFNFALPAKHLIKVLEIVGDKPSPFIQPVFGNQSIFSFVTNNYQNVEKSQLEDAELVLLNQVQNPTNELMLQLVQLANRGKTVLIIPSESIDLEPYQIANSNIALNPTPSLKKLNPPLAESPFFKTFLEKTSKKYEMPNATNVVVWGNDRSAILSYEDGSPYLSEVSNHLYLLGGPIIESFSNFQTHALFVPVMYGLASQSSTPTGQLFSRVKNKEYDLALSLNSPKEIIKLTLDQLEIIPNKQQLGGTVRISFPKDITKTGSYKLTVQDSLRAYLSINLDKEESKLTPMLANEITMLFPNARVKFLDSYNPNQRNLNYFNAGKSLWRYALTICLLFLALETLLIRFL